MTRTIPRSQFDHDYGTLFRWRQQAHPYAQGRVHRTPGYVGDRGLFVDGRHEHVRWRDTEWVHVAYVLAFIVILVFAVFAAGGTFVLGTQHP